MIDFERIRAAHGALGQRIDDLANAVSTAQMAETELGHALAAKQSADEQLVAADLAAEQALQEVVEALAAGNVTLPAPTNP